MDTLRGRVVSPRAGELPVTHAKAWRHTRPHARVHTHHGHGWGGLRPPLLHALLALATLLAVVRLGGRLAGGPQPELEDLVRLDGDGPNAQPAAGWRGEPAHPKLIPRLIHRPAPTGPPPPRLKAFAASWRQLNPGWEVRQYSEAACMAFVRDEFPQYLEAYRRLSKGAERSDFFRYMVVLRHGGVWADPSAECVRPLDALLASSDTLVAGWGGEFADARAALDAGFVRQRQLVQAVFAGAPGHPALRELCEGVAAAAGAPTAFSSDPELDAAERTGGGLFTDVLLRHAAAHPPGRRDDPWAVRLLPRVRFGAPTAPAFGLAPGDPGVAVLLHADTADAAAAAPTGRRWRWAGAAADAAAAAAAAWAARRQDAAGAALRLMEQRDAAVRLYPVSADFEPPYDLMTHRAGAGERQSGADVSAALTAHGGWQPSVQPARRPSLADALVGSLGGAGARRNVLVDVGAGYGVLSLAAAARGHRVHAWELGPGSLEALEAAVARNGFDHLVEVHREALGSPEQEGYTCIQPKQPAGGGAAAAEALRGYGPAALHATPADGCQLMTRRSAGAWAVPEGERVAALRVSANGWEGWVLRGFAPLLQRSDRPAVVAVEWSPPAMRAAGWRRPLALVEWLMGLGYADVSHSGYVCDKRWYAITYGVRRRGGIRPEDLAGLRQPTWCRLLPEDLPLLLDSSAGAHPEMLLFVSRPGNASAAGAPRGEARSAPEPRHGGGGGGGGAPGGADKFGVPDVVAEALAAAAAMVADPAANRTATADADMAAAAGSAGGGAGGGATSAPRAEAAQPRARRRGGSVQRRGGAGQQAERQPRVEP